MVQSEIQAAQDAALGSQKLGLGEGASTQEAEGGGLRIGEKDRGRDSLPWVRVCPCSGPQFSGLYNGTIDLLCGRLGEYRLQSQKNLDSSSNPTTPHCVTWASGAH